MTTPGSPTLRRSTEAIDFIARHAAAKRLPKLVPDIADAMGLERIAYRWDEPAELIEEAAREARSITERWHPNLSLYADHDRTAFYMERWWLRHSPEGGLYIQVFTDDDPAALHDHPWTSASLLLTGELVEVDHSPDGRHLVTPGTLVIRSHLYRHRLQIARAPAISLFACGRDLKPWGFEKADGTIREFDPNHPDQLPSVFAPDAGRRAGVEDPAVRGNDA